MKKSILKLGKTLSRNQQKKIKGGMIVAIDGPGSGSRHGYCDKNGSRWECEECEGNHLCGCEGNGTYCMSEED